MREQRKHEVFLRVARLLGELGTCDRAYVGAVIVKDGRCISWGYNGAPPGAPHCADNEHGWLGHGGTLPGSGLFTQGCRNATHAEANAVAFAARQGISTDGGTLYVSIEPCRTCSMILVAAGIVMVVAFKAYERDNGREVLKRAGIELITGGEYSGEDSASWST